MEELQDIWAKGNSNEKNENWHSEEQLRELLVSKSKNTISKMNRNMLIDAIIALVIGLSLIGIVIYLRLDNQTFMIASILIMMGLMAIHYRIKYVSLNRIELESISIRDGIIKLVQRLELYRKLYLIIIPSITSLLFTLVHILFFGHLIGTWYNSSSFWIWEALVIPTIFIVYLVVKLIFNRMYGKQLAILKLALQDLDSNNIT